MQLSDYEHIIWDWNGTLLDDIEIAMGVTNGMLADRNLPQLSRDSYREVFGFPIADYYRRIGFDVSRFDLLAEEFVQGFYAESGRFRLQPGAADTLAAVQASGLTQSILSASHESDLQLSVRRLGIDHYFDSIDGLTDNHARSKIARGQQSMQRLAVAPARALLIGDTTHDAEVAQALGCDCLLVAAGHQSPQRLERHAAEQTAPACSISVIPSLMFAPLPAML